jgi:hypothetical protein
MVRADIYSLCDPIFATIPTAPAQSRELCEAAEKLAELP